LKRPEPSFCERPAALHKIPNRSDRQGEKEGWLGEGIFLPPSLPKVLVDNWENKHN